MPRSKTGVVRRQKHKKVIKANKGYYLTRSKLWRRAHQAWLRAGEHMFAGRKLRKRDFRRLWIQRINAALTPLKVSYSTFIRGLIDAKIELNRKVLADIALKDPETFKKIVEKTGKTPEQTKE